MAGTRAALKVVPWVVVMVFVKVGMLGSVTVALMGALLVEYWAEMLVAA